MTGWEIGCPSLNGNEFEQAPGVGDGQGSLECCRAWGLKEWDTTEQLNWLNIPLCVHTTLCLSIHRSVAIWVAYSFWLLWMIWLRSEYTVLLNVCPEVKFLDKIPFLIFWETSILSSTAAMPFYIRINRAQESQLRLILTSGCCFLGFVCFWR